MTKKVVLGGILGGLTLFAWSSIAHVVLQLGEIGIQELTAEAVVVGALKENVRQPGFYMFPGRGAGGGQMTPAQTEAWMNRIRQGPTGMLLYSPAGADPNMTVQLPVELATNVLAALLVSFLLSWVGPAGSEVRKSGEP